MDNQYKDENLKGALWNENACKVIRKGTVMINGKKEYISILKFTLNGNDKYELVKSCGLLHVNDEESKLNPKSPDIGGAVTIDGVEYKFGGWKRVNQEKGTEYTSVGLRPVSDNDATYEDHSANIEVDENIPF